MRKKTIGISIKKTLMTSARLVGFDAPTVWQEFTPLSNRLKSVNLGQGFPDWTAPPFIKRALVNAVLNDNNQYCRSGGEVLLVNALAKHYGPLVGRTIDPLKEVTTSVGATEGIFAIMQAYINAGAYR
jgi:kynurenine---oxoglutarate transaminase / cysteine-S-conjugate beta-lyase / glutamine---phenylpyruvate transaminase